MKIVRSILTGLLCGRDDVGQRISYIMNTPCCLHGTSTTRVCSGSGCNHLVCDECESSPMKGECVECAIKEMAHDVTAFVIGGAVGIAFCIFATVFVASQGMEITAPGKWLIYLLAQVVMCVFWYHGARKWAQIGHAETGFAQPEGLKYPLYGTWLLWHWLIRFSYYLMFASMPFFIGPFVGIPVMIRTIKKALHIRKHRRAN